MTEHSWSDDDLMQPSEVAKVFGVHPRTVGRWARTGFLPSQTTIGGHRRFRYGDIRKVLGEPRRADG